MLLFCLARDGRLIASPKQSHLVLTLSKQNWNVFFNGRKGENGKTIDQGLVGIRSPKAAETIMETVRKLEDARANRK